MTVEQARATQLANIATATGTPLDDWFALIEARRAEGLAHGQLVAWLKADHGLGHGNANALVHASAESRGDPPVDLVAAQYAGPKAGLRALYDEIVARVSGFGDDVEIAPKKTSVSLRRSKQFAVLTPAARNRLDIGLNLRGEPADGVLEAATGMCTHRIPIGALDDLDEDVLGWLRAAYERA